MEAVGKALKEEEADSTDKTESFDEGSDGEAAKQEHAEETTADPSSKLETVVSSGSKGRKRLA